MKLSFFRHPGVVIPDHNEQDGPQKKAVEVQDSDFAEGYDDLAKKLGVKCKMLSKLEKFLHEHAIQIYDLAAVEKYMDKKGEWCWYPLRAKDCVETKDHVWRITRSTPHKYPGSYGYQDNHQYDKPVPFPVLLTVKAIHDHFGEDALFLVAAPAQHPDPFLGVMQRSNFGRLFVVERWDEPSFRS